MIAEKERSDLRESLSHVLFSNPVLVGGLVLGQLAAGATSLQNGVALTVTFLFVTLPVLVFAAAFGRSLPKWSRVAVYMLLSTAMLYPSYLVCKNISATVLDSVGIYLPILAVSTIPSVYSARFSEKHNVMKAVTDGLCLTLGFGVVAVLLGILRELLGSGTLWNVKVTEATFPSLKLPFWGFILIGFMAAAVAGLRTVLNVPDYVEPIREDEEATK